MKMIDESIFDWLAQGLGFRRCSDEGEGIDRNSDIASFWHDHIDYEVFHRDIQYFFYVWFESMNFIDKQDISGLECI